MNFVKLIIGAVVLLIAACTRESREVNQRTTTVIGTQSDMIPAFFQRCPAQVGSQYTYTSRALTQNAASRHVYLCAELAGASVRDAYVEMRGTHHLICAIRVGPARLLRPLESFAFAAEWFRDQGMAKAVLDAIGKPNPRRELELDTRVDGFRVQVEFKEGFYGPTLFLEIDGCDRLPNDVIEVRLEGREDAADIFTPLQERYERAMERAR